METENSSHCTGADLLETCAAHSPGTSWQQHPADLCLPAVSYRLDIFYFFKFTQAIKLHSELRIAIPAFPLPSADFHVVSLINLHKSLDKF